MLRIHTDVLHTGGLCLGRLLNKKYSVPDGCAEGVIDGRVEGLALGVAVEKPGAVVV